MVSLAGRFPGISPDTCRKDEWVSGKFTDKATRGQDNFRAGQLAETFVLICSK